MENEKKINLLDLLVILVKWKKVLILILLPAMVLIYLAIYFIIEEQFDANAIIIPAEDQTLGGFSAILGDLGNNLPFDIGGSIPSQEMSLYNTIIYSRSNLENVINKFDL
ncbi:MAG: Wzz/FepE/Etk N-terminal domain-containing protein, partial [Nitrososphaeraceae archaeon]|nr:Wzz/FepE/Etk N-terminal domain-containing protein [Nitrososphaeraceae archaeon]